MGYPVCLHRGSSLKSELVPHQDIHIPTQKVRKNRILNILDILEKEGVFEIRLFGGEFTVFKAWRDILQYAYQKDFFISFVSNGYLLGKEEVKLLVACGVHECTISIHGPEEIHDRITKKVGSFRRAMSAIGLLQKQKVVVSVAFTPNVENLDYVYTFVHLLSMEYGVKHFSISRLFSDDRYERLKLSDYHQLLGEIKRCHCELGVNISLADSFHRCMVPVKYWQYLSYCSQGVSFAQIDFNGNLKHCSATSQPLGNLFEVDMKELWGRKLDDMRSLEHLPKSCKICPIFCGGGCTVSRGVECKFAPDEFIPLPKDDGWISATRKAIYNQFRKLMLNFFYLSEQIIKTSELSEYPKLTQRYRIRRETDEEYLVMFEKSGVKIISPLAMYVLTLLTGKYTGEAIYKKSCKKFPWCEKPEVEEIISRFI